MKKKKTPPENKDMEMCGFSDRGFLLAVLEKLNEMQINIDRKLNELTKQINKQPEYFIKEIPTLKKKKNNKKFSR